MSSIFSERNIPLARLIPLALLVALLTSVGCSTTPLADSPRSLPREPLPASVQARYAVPGDVSEETLVPLGGEDGLTFYRGSIRAGPERAAFTLILPALDVPPSFVLALPILAGGQDLMWHVALDLAERGYAVAWPRRVASALREDQRGPELEELFRRSVVHARMVLAWARQQPQLRPDSAALVGISLGSMIGGAVMATEPSLRAGALCLAGGDLADMLMVSSEPRAERWRRARFERDGIARSELQHELQECLRSDPARLAPWVDPAAVLMVSASYDSVVPRRHQDVLWQALGQPRRMWVPLGHYTAVLGLPGILNAIGEFFAARGV